MEYFFKQSYLLKKKKKSWASFSLSLNSECKYSSAKKPLVLADFSQRSGYGLMGWTLFSLTTLHLREEYDGTCVTNILITQD